MITKEEIDKFLAKADEAELEAVKDKDDPNLRDTWLIIAASYRDLARLRVLKDKPGTHTGPAPENDVEIIEGHIRETESHIATQRVRIEELRRDGNPTLQSEILLKMFEDTLRVYQACLTTLHATQAGQDQATFDKRTDKPKL
jgi:hypothetical protein